MAPWLIWHRWLSLLAGPLTVVAAGTAIALNHQDLLAPPPAPAAAATSPFAEYMLCAWVDPVRPRHVLIGTAKGLYATHDDGARWTKIAAVPSQVIALAAAPDGLYLAARTEGVWRSTDAGSTWAALPQAPTPLHGLAVAGPEVHVLAAGGLYRRADGGWKRVDRSTPVPEAAGRGVLRTIYGLHDGTFWGRGGVAVTDLTSMLLLLLVASGYRSWWARVRSRRGA